MMEGNNNNNNGGGNGGNGGGNGGSGSTSGGGSSSSGSRGAITVTSGGPGDQTVTIDAGDVPLAELPDAPVSPVEIDDGEVPLAALPKTGQTTMKLTILLMFSGILPCADCHEQEAQRGRILKQREIGCLQEETK